MSKKGAHKDAGQHSPYTRIRVELCAARSRNVYNRIIIYLSRSFQVLGQDMQYEEALDRIADAFGTPLGKRQWKELKKDAEKARKRIQMDTPGIDVEAFLDKAGSIRPDTGATDRRFEAKIFERIDFGDWAYLPPKVRQKLSNYLLAKGSKKRQSSYQSLFNAGVRIGSYERGKPETLLKEGTELWQQVRRAHRAAQSFPTSTKRKSEKESGPSERSIS